MAQAAAPCTINLAPTGLSGVDQFGAASSFTYTTSVSNCAHTLVSNTSFLTITGNTYAGTNGSVSFSVALNPYGASRSGVIKVANTDFTVTQNPSTCVYTLSSFGETFGRLGTANASFSVAAVPNACAAPGLLVNGPPGMVTLNATTGAGAGLFNANYGLSIFQSLVNYVRTAQIVVGGGQVYTVKQRSF